jgi:hypothetical protein
MKFHGGLCLRVLCKLVFLISIEIKEEKRIGRHEEVISVKDL